MRRVIRLMEAMMSQALEEAMVAFPVLGEAVEMRDGGVELRPGIAAIG